MAFACPVFGTVPIVRHTTQIILFLVLFLFLLYLPGARYQYKNQRAQNITNLPNNSIVATISKLLPLSPITAAQTTYF